MQTRASQHVLAGNTRFTVACAHVWPADLGQEIELNVEDIDEAPIAPEASYCQPAAQHRVRAAGLRKWTLQPACEYAGELHTVQHSPCPVQLLGVVVLTLPVLRARTGGAWRARKMSQGWERGRWSVWNARGG